MVESWSRFPASYQFVDHSMFRAFNKGAMGAMEVEGALQPALFSGRQAEEIYNPGTRLQRVAMESAPAVPTAPSDAVISLAPAEAKAGGGRGEELFKTVCATCHQPDGRGMPGVFPPLAHSDFLMGNVDEPIRVLIEGRQGPITVNGKTYEGVMPDLSLTDHDIASVLSYVRSNLGNAGSAVTPADVRRVRGMLADANAGNPQSDEDDRR